MLKLAIPVLLLMNFGEPRVAQETNLAPDVIIRDSEIAPVAAKPPAVAEPVKSIDLEASAAAAKIKSLNARVFEAKLAVTQANGQVDALKGRLDKSQDELDKIWTERLDLDIKLASVRAERDNAFAAIKRLTEEKERDARRYEDLSAWNRKLYAMHLFILLLITLGVFLYFVFRRLSATVIARLPDEDTRDTIKLLRDELEELKLNGFNVASERIHALIAACDQEHAQNILLTEENADLRQLGVRDRDEIDRLVALQQGTEAAINGMQRDLQEAQDLLETMTTPTPQHREMTEEEAEVEHDELVNHVIAEAKHAVVTAGELHVDPEIVAAASATIDALEKSRAAMHEPVPEPVDPTEESTKPIASDPPPITDKPTE